MRTEYDLEMMQEMGFCNGIENYSRHLTGRPPGSTPFTLLDFFPKDFLLVIDESHATIPQIGGMYEGDKSRKTVLVEYGFRLPSALDNRPLNFPEFMGMTNQIVYVSATPAEFEIKNSIVGNNGYFPHKRARIGEEELVPFRRRWRDELPLVRRRADARPSDLAHRPAAGAIRCPHPGRAARRRADHPPDRLARPENHAQTAQEPDRRHDRALPAAGRNARSACSSPR